MKKPLLTLWIPIVALVLAIVDGIVHLPWMFEELGVIENFTVIFLLGAIVLLVVRAFRGFGKMKPLDKALLVVMVLGCIYFAGEELSWGQHFGEAALGIKAEAGRWEGNYQNEMNLHNRHGLLGLLLDRLPRSILTGGIALGGIIFPFVKRRLPAWIARYVMGKETLVVAILAVFVSVPNKLMKMFTTADVGFDAGEMKEFYIALFILLFAMNFVRILRAEGEQQASA